MPKSRKSSRSSTHKLAWDTKGNCNSMLQVSGAEIFEVSLSRACAGHFSRSQELTYSFWSTCHWNIWTNFGPRGIFGLILVQNDSEIANFLRSRLRRSRDALFLLVGHVHKKDAFTCVRLAQFRAYAQKHQSTFGTSVSIQRLHEHTGGRLSSS